jgi:DNA-binding transcriptional LysR family regulator
MDLLARGLKLSHLRILAALSRTGQIGLAAAQTGMSQPAASRLLAEVETLTGHPVHRREGRGVALTEAGMRLATRAARILAELADAGRDLSDSAEGLHGNVALGAVTGPALDLVLPALRLARLALPRVTVEVEVGPSDLLADLLLSARLDFTLARVPPDRDPALFDLLPVGPEPVSLLIRAGHALAGRTDLTPRDLLAYDWILPGPSAILTRTVRARFQALGLPDPPGRLSTSSFLLTLALVRQSNAIAPMARAVALRFAEPGSPYAVLGLDLGITVAPFGLMTRAGAALPPAARRLRDLVLAVHPEVTSESAEFSPLSPQ